MILSVINTCNCVKLLCINHLPPSVPIWHCLAKLSILILEGIIKKIPMGVATMSR